MHRGRDHRHGRQLQRVGAAARVHRLRQAASFGRRAGTPRCAGATSPAHRRRARARFDRQTNNAVTAGRAAPRAIHPARTATTARGDAADRGAGSRYPPRGMNAARRRRRRRWSRASARRPRSPSCRSRSRPGRSTACSAPTARARPRRCGCWPGSWCRRAGSARVAGLDVARDPLGGAPAARLPHRHHRPLRAADRAASCCATSGGCTASPATPTAARIEALAERARAGAVLRPPLRGAVDRRAPAAVDRAGGAARSRPCWSSTSRPPASTCWRRGSCATSSAPNAIAARR